MDPDWDPTTCRAGSGSQKDPPCRIMIRHVGSGSGSKMTRQLGSLLTFFGYEINIFGSTTPGHIHSFYSRFSLTVHHMYTHPTDLTMKLEKNI
jgi:hypothetical protein